MSVRTSGRAPKQLTVVVGISGGIAAYKTVSLIRLLVLDGHNVQVVATDNALRFIGRPTLEAISRNPVCADLYEGVPEVRHVAMGQTADLIIVAPATANTIAKLAGGFADDLLCSTVLAARAPVVIAPAMHTEMWENAATVANMAILRERGIMVVGPASGQLTGSDSGVGRMSEPGEIMAAALGALCPQDLSGLRILITAGGTREPLDPVRFIGNRSSGRQGVALAMAASQRGAEVTLIAAHLEIEPPPTVTRVDVGSAREMAEAVTDHAPIAEVIIMAAAVADYRPDTVVQSKMTKESLGDTPHIRLIKNPDILAGLSESRVSGQLIIGFAAETELDDLTLIERGRAKISRKGCDYLVLNRVGWNEGFSSTENSITVIDAGGAVVSETSGTKLSVAHRILDLLSAR
ncbi:MAG: bifunctional phosphopantothenoylcysteine decarboxylase/phosphopantothenate--cysteine ligase CoaBC [Rhodoglobus sp.]